MDSIKLLTIALAVILGIMLMLLVILAVVYVFSKMKKNNNNKENNILYCYVFFYKHIKHIELLNLSDNSNIKLTMIK